MDYLELSSRHLKRDFSKCEKVLEVPYLLELQKSSFERFLQLNKKPEEREDIGLQAALKSIFPIKNYDETASLEFVNYIIGEPKYDVDECKERGMTYGAPLKITVQLVLWDKDPVTGAKTIKNVKEQQVYLGEIPLMTEKGTFIINGTERVIVSQLQRSPGVYFDHDRGKTLSGIRPLYSARIIPYKGSWLDFEFDQKDTLYVKIDKRKKVPATVLLRALGYSTSEIYRVFFKTERIIIEGDKFFKEVDPGLILNQRATDDVIDPRTGEVIIKKGRRFNNQIIRKIEELGLKQIQIKPESIINEFSASDIVHENTGEQILRCGEQITEEKLEEIKNRNIREFELLFIDRSAGGMGMLEAIKSDKIHTQDDALVEIFKKLKPSEPPTIENARTYFDGLFFSPERYDLSRVGRLKLNHKLGLNVDLDHTTLRKEDILAVVRYLVDLRNGFGNIDDIDHLGNRRVRSVGELLENALRIGLMRMERAIKERMSVGEIDAMLPHDLINAKPVAAVLREFFGSGQLSQFMDQTNPLSELTHKRRLSALGPGGLTRERAGFEVRDVHPTHYGRICPIETPEGPNIGLISSLSCYARVNEFGFIETPYREVRNGVVTKNIKYLSALEEEKYTIAQSNIPLDKNGKILGELVPARKGGEFTLVRPEEVDFMDVSPIQLVSAAASLIPFLEHDDANRALMGSNMQRQAVPLLRTEAPLVGTGMEGIIAKDSGAVVVAKRDGIVEYVDASRIVIRAEFEDTDGGSSVDIYNLVKFRRSNQNTCINEKPLVKKGQRVRKGQVIADGPATERGELALGRNVLVAFMPWGGYNFEDSILISERLVIDDVYTSIHIEEFECVARDTKLGKEEITADIPNVGEEALKNLDENGIVRIGAEVKTGDILVGKVTPKGETMLSPEEKLLRAIFGDKAGEFRDTSLRVPPGIEGIVIDTKIFTRRGEEKDERTRMIEEREIEALKKDQEEEIKIIKDSAYERIKRILIGKVTASRLMSDDKSTVLIGKGKEITEEVLSKIPKKKWAEISLVDEEAQKEIKKILVALKEQVDFVKKMYENKINKVKRGDELPPGVIKMVKVYLAIKRKISVGDKMAGRHGNKGVISRILPIEDMPYLADGTPVDIVLNPLGVPSRMNVGQILETHLGWACHEIGKKLSELTYKVSNPRVLRKKLKEVFKNEEISKLIDRCSDEEILEIISRYENGIHCISPVFSGAKEEEIREMLEYAGLPVTGQTVLYDGRTGEPFDNKVTVGVMYMMKLHHLVDDKIHARSIGPYSLVTQQPLGGKAQFGGQRLGEMEVWALEAYGAAHTLQEFLTVKSDDIIGRTRMYDSIVKGTNVLEPGLPESFSVLVKELQSLCLNVDLIEDVEEVNKKEETKSGKKI